MVCAKPGLTAASCRTAVDRSLEVLRVGDPRRPPQSLVTLFSPVLLAALQGKASLLPPSDRQPG